MPAIMEAVTRQRGRYDADRVTSKEYVPGVGLGIKRAVRKALGLRANEQLAVIITEAD